MTVLNCYITIQNNFLLFLAENEEFGILHTKLFQIGLNYGTELFLILNLFFKDSETWNQRSKIS